MLKKVLLEDFFHAEESAAGGCSGCGGCVVDALCIYVFDASCRCAACFERGSLLVMGPWAKAL